MTPGQMVHIKSGRLANCDGVLDEVVANDDAPAYRVTLNALSVDAYAKGFRLGDQVDLDRHELEPKP